MRILSRYVLGRFVGPLGLSLGAFIAIFVVVDLMDRLSAFIDRGAPTWAILMYYVWYAPTIAVLVLPMAMLLASLFCIGDLARHNELMAMKAIGVSLYRIVLPVQVFALLVSVGAFFLADRVVPEANRRRAAMVRGQHLPYTPRVRQQVVLRDVKGQVLSVTEYAMGQKTGHRVMLDRYRERRLVEKILAEKMVWEDGRWVFYRGELRVFEGEGETVVRFEKLRPEGLSLRPEDLSREEREVEQMDFQELGAYIDRKELNGEDARRERVERHLRVSFPFASFVIVLFGVPLSSRTRRTGRPLQVGICLFTCFVFYGCIQAGRAMGWNGILPPVWGAWAANLLFLCLGTLMLARTHK